MTSLRHSLAQLGWLQLLAASSIVCALLGCPAELHPALRAGNITAPLTAGSVHVVVRSDLAALARSSSLMLGVSAPDAAIAVVPDDPEAMGASGSSVGLELSDELGASCPATGLCEVGLTIFVESISGPPPASVRLDLTARGGDSSFAGARLELQIDGEEPVVATETSL